MNLEHAPELTGIEDAALLTELLAGYLHASHWIRYPGADGQTTEEVVVAEYPAASAAGSVPGPDELAHRHPELAAAVAAFFGRSGHS